MRAPLIRTLSLIDRRKQGIEHRARGVLCFRERHIVLPQEPLIRTIVVEQLAIAAPELGALSFCRRCQAV